MVTTTYLVTVINVPQPAHNVTVEVLRTALNVRAHGYFTLNRYEITVREASKKKTYNIFLPSYSVCCNVRRLTTTSRVTAAAATPPARSVRRELLSIARSVPPREFSIKTK